MFRVSPLSYGPEYSIRESSPLAILNPNACPRFSLQMASTGQTSCDTSKYSYKRAMNNPLLERKSNEEQDRKRRAFLEKVRRVSDDKKWESRSEQILRKDFLSRQKEWEFDQARSAPEASRALDDDEREAESIPMEGKNEIEMVDQILSQQNQELMALVSSIQDGADIELHQQQTIESDYGSDEEEYDQLFIELMSRQGAAEKSSSTAGDDAPEQEMDISTG